jgi:hypothetical protein
MPAASEAQRDRAIALAKQTGLPVLMVPNQSDLQPMTDDALATQRA